MYASKRRGILKDIMESALSKKPIILNVLLAIPTLAKMIGLLVLLTSASIIGSIVLSCDKKRIAY